MCRMHESRKEVFKVETQLKKGLIEFCILAALRKEDSYGYRLVEVLSDYVSLSESTLYPILKRLEKNGYVETYSVEHNSRLRRYYQITQSGKKHLQNFVGTWPEMVKIYQYIKGEE